MIPETKRTCATCPFARHIDGDRYTCSATHNHHNSVTRGHWETTQDCNDAIAALDPQEEGNRGSGRTDADVNAKPYIPFRRCTLFNPKTGEYTFKYEPGCYEVPGIYLRFGYQIAEGSDGQRYVYDSTGLDFGLTCQEALDRWIAFLDEPLTVNGQIGWRLGSTTLVKLSSGELVDAYYEIKATEDVEYVMQLEERLEKSESQTVQQEQFSEVALTASYGIEVDSIKPDVYRIWAGSSLLGTMRRTSAGWMARPDSSKPSWHSTPGDAQEAVVAAALPY